MDVPVLMLTSNLLTILKKELSDLSDGRKIAVFIISPCIPGGITLAVKHVCRLVDTAIL